MLSTLRFASPIAFVLSLAASAHAQCSGTIGSTYSGVWPFGTRTYSWAECIGSCGCAVQTAASGTHQFCGCPGVGEQACCHVVLEGYLDPTGAFVPTNVSKKGDCPNCATTGACVFSGYPSLGFDTKTSVYCGY